MASALVSLHATCFRKAAKVKQLMASVNTLVAAYLVGEPRVLVPRLQQLAPDSMELFVVRLQQGPVLLSHLPANNAFPLLELPAVGLR